MQQDEFRGKELMARAVSVYRDYLFNFIREDESVKAQPEELASLVLKEIYPYEAMLEAEVPDLLKKWNEANDNQEIAKAALYAEAYLKAVADKVDISIEGKIRDEKHRQELSDHVMNNLHDKETGEYIQMLTAALGKKICNEAATSGQISAFDVDYNFREYMEQIRIVSHMANATHYLVPGADGLKKAVDKEAITKAKDAAINYLKKQTSHVTIPS